MAWACEASWLRPHCPFGIMTDSDTIVKASQCGMFVPADPPGRFPGNRFRFPWSNVAQKRSTLIATATAHAMAWLVFLWLIFPHCIFGGFSPKSTAMVIGSCPLDYDLWGASWYFVPVLLTGVALVLVLAFRMPRWWGTLILGFLSIAVVGICLMGYLGFGIGYVPSALAMLVGTVLHSARHHLGSGQPGPGAGRLGDLRGCVRLLLWEG